jgi:hypothetical protein
MVGTPNTDDSRQTQILPDASRYMPITQQPRDEREVRHESGVMSSGIPPTKHQQASLRCSMPIGHRPRR